MGLPKVPMSFLVPQELKDRIEKFVNSTASPVKSKRMFLENAIGDYLEREEPIVQMIEKEFAKIRGEYR